MAPYSVGGHQILVQLPGLDDVERAKEIIRSTALLELKLVEEGPSPTREGLLQTRNGVVPPDMEVLSGASDILNPGGAPETLYYLVRRVAAVTGRDLRNARPSLDEFNQPAVSFRSTGKARASLVTSPGRTWGAISPSSWTGGCRPLRRFRVVLRMRAGSAAALPRRRPLTWRSSSGREPSRRRSPIWRSGRSARSSAPTRSGPGVVALVSGLAAVALFMLVYYRLTGINAIVAVAMNLLILLGFMAYIDAVLTLPGIAGLILTIGIGVDSNVLIFERIKEELRAEKAVRSAVTAGFDRVFLTILDTHVASLIAAAFLFQFGSGPIRGFATTLAIGLISNIFTALFVSRTLFEATLSGRRTVRLSI